MRSTSAGVAWSPAITAAGSPGAMNSRLNTNRATTTMTGMVARIRLTM
jgi:hypothetical protein